MDGSGSERRVAVFVDGDNLSVDHAPAIRGVAGRLGHTTIRHVYGRSASLANWDAAPDFFGIRVGDVKNGADILLSMKAVELAMEGRMEAAVIASNDRDFSHAAHWLRERGVHVVGLGAPKAAGAIDWRSCCVEAADLPQVTAPEPKPPARPVRPSGPHDAVRDVIARFGHGGALRMDALGPLLHREHGLTLAKVGATSWRAFLTGAPQQFDVDPKGRNAFVRAKTRP